MTCPGGRGKMATGDDGGTADVLGFGKRGLKLNLALQGGGAHGAFTWGVLDRLLDESDIEYGWISGTSAGAVNAVAFADGFAEGGRPGARDRLRAIWEAVIEAGVPDLLRLNPFLYGMSRSPAMGQVASLFSPYDFNPLGFDPMRKLLASQIDFERLRAYDGLELLIAATDVATARPRLFRRREMSVQAVLAWTTQVATPGGTTRPGLQWLRATQAMGPWVGSITSQSVTWESSSATPSNVQFGCICTAARA